MSVGPLVPCLWFDDEAEAAAALYARTFPNAKVGRVARYPSSTDNPSKKPRGSVLTVEFEIDGLPFTALNGGPAFEINPSISFFAHLDGKDTVDRVFAALADGGKVLMPLDQYPWSERYAWVQDRFGVTWQLMLGRGETAVEPCLMFVGAQQGKAHQAIEQYTRIFPGGDVIRVEEYGAGEGPVGSVKHGRFTIAGQVLVAMDSHLAHDFGFNEGVSLQVMCDGQDDVDRIWRALADGGEEGPCGWLKDRFGVSWQVVPKAMARFLSSDDEAARTRAFQAMMPMKKLDVAALQAAFDGR